MPLKSFIYAFLLGFISLPLLLQAQDQPYGGGQDQLFFSGDLESNASFFIEDEEIGATNIPQYDNQLIGIETWLNLSMSYKGYDIGMRLDLFNNSNLRDPNGSYNGQGIGRWHIHKKINKLDITGGYIYDQIGSGIIFRAYEERPLFIDNALLGIKLAYDLGENWNIRAFAGKQKNIFEQYGANIKGLDLEGFIKLKDSKVSLAPGFGIVNRTLSDESVQSMIDEVAFYLKEDQDQVELKYNTFAFSLYNRLTAGAFSWYIEGAIKTDEALFDPYEQRLLASGEYVNGQLINYNGSVIYSSLTYAKSGLGITLEGKRTEGFSFRTDPKLDQTDGLINYLPPMNRENTYRLTSRYSPATQDLGEIAIQADIGYSPNKKWSFNVNFSNITDLDNELLYREIYTEILFKKSRKWRLSGGLQLQEYNQEIYEGKGDVPNVETVTPFAEFLYKFSRKKSLRLEAQYLSSDQDFGSWAYALAEFGLAPHWIFTVSDMYNTDPKKKTPGGELKKIHYPTVGVVYAHKTNRFSLSYVKQVEGIVCTGGVCRLEPAFSGFKFTVNSTF